MLRAAILHHNSSLQLPAQLPCCSDNSALLLLLQIGTSQYLDSLENGLFH